MEQDLHTAAFLREQAYNPKKAKGEEGHHTLMWCVPWGMYPRPQTSNVYFMHWSNPNSPYGTSCFSRVTYGSLLSRRDSPASPKPWVVFGFEISGGGTQVQRTERDGLGEKEMN
jgi:hypothetical protein